MSIIEWDIESKDKTPRKPLKRVFCTVNYDIDEGECPTCGETVYNCFINCSICGTYIDWKLTDDEYNKFIEHQKDPDKEHRWFTLD